MEAAIFTIKFENNNKTGLPNSGLNRYLMKMYQKESFVVYFRVTTEKH